VGLNLLAWSLQDRLAGKRLRIQKLTGGKGSLLETGICRKHLNRFHGHLYPDVSIEGHRYEVSEDELVKSGDFMVKVDQF
jgi:hypothetical protein